MLSRAYVYQAKDRKRFFDVSIGISNKGIKMKRRHLESY